MNEVEDLFDLDLAHVVLGTTCVAIATPSLYWLSSFGRDSEFVSGICSLGLRDSLPQSCTTFMADNHAGLPPASLPDQPTRPHLTKQSLASREGRISTTLPNAPTRSDMPSTSPFSSFGDGSGSSSSKVAMHHHPHLTRY